MLTLTLASVVAEAAKEDPSIYERLNDAWTLGLAAIAVVISVIALFTQHSNESEANDISRDARDLARDANRTAAAALEAANMSNDIANAANELSRSSMKSDVVNYVFPAIKETQAIIYDLERFIARDITLQNFEGVSPIAGANLTFALSIVGPHSRIGQFYHASMPIFYAVERYCLSCRNFQSEFPLDLEAIGIVKKMNKDARDVLIELYADLSTSMAFLAIDDNGVPMGNNSRINIDLLERNTSILEEVRRTRERSRLKYPDPDPMDQPPPYGPR